MRLLCLSNGHGEDAIALRILQALQQQPNAPSIEALPIVGEGHAYTQAGIPLIGSVKPMPSGGFIYMDGRQLARDIQGGLVQLTLAQLRAIQAWAKENGEWGAGSGEWRREDAETRGRGDVENSKFKIQNSKLIQNSTPTPYSPLPTPFILAVGDIVPLLFAWRSGVPYAFVGTAKSEYYLRDEAGWLPRDSWWSDRLQRWTGCVYHPWERWLMSHPNCKAVFPRDSLTAKVLKQHGIPAFDLGNPMMDGLERGKDKGLRIKDQKDASSFSLDPLSLSIALLPGSRPPEAYANWEAILLAVNGLIAKTERPLEVLAAIAPGLNLEKLHQIILDFRWQHVSDNSYSVGLGEKRATLVLAQNRFAEFLHRADVAIAMTGTGAEQFAGLGKPVITISGKGPQFTPAFAEAQTRLLGPSVWLVAEPAQVADAVQSLFSNPDRLQTIAKNGCRRMGEPGAARRIAQCLIECANE